MKFCVFKTKERLDKYLVTILNSSRKQVKLFFEKKKVRLNNKNNILKSTIIKHKDLIEIDLSNNINFFDYHKVPIDIVFEDNNFLGVYKPSFFHSAKIINNPISIEDFIKQINLNYILLNRLDYETEGILLVAKNKKAFSDFKDLEKNNFIKKKYLGILEGRINNKIELSNQIIMAKRKKVKVINKNDVDFYTRIIPIALYKKFTIVDILIYKGARHQIRAHASFAGYPFFKDCLYGGNKNKGQNNRFFLFCYEIYCKKLNLKINIKDKLKLSLKKYLVNNI